MPVNTTALFGSSSMYTTTTPCLHSFAVLATLHSDGCCCRVEMFVSLLPADTCAVGFPASLLYEELYAANADLQVVLTTRDAAAWAEAMASTYRAHEWVETFKRWEMPGSCASAPCLPSPHAPLMRPVAPCPLPPAPPTLQHTLAPTT